MTDLVKPGQLYEVLPDGRWAFFFDSSTLRTFTECEQMFFYRYVKNYGVRGRAFKTEIGSWWSHTLELYYKSFQAGDLTVDKAADFALHVWAEKQMPALRARYPKSYADFGGENGAIVMVVQYYAKMNPVDERHWKVVAAEEGAGRLRELKVGEDDKVVVYYIVKPDLFVIEDDKYLMPVDHKTKDYIWPKLIHTFKPHQQLMGYIVAGQQLAHEVGLSHLVVNRCAVNVAARREPGPKAKERDRFTRYPVQYSASQLHEWRVRTIEAARRMRDCFERHAWQWNDSACHKFGGCNYRVLDAQPPEAREQIVKATFDIGEIWTPYKTDEELFGDDSE